MNRTTRRVQRRLAQRQAEFDRLSIPDRQGRKRPGSLNRRKS